MGCSHKGCTYRGCRFDGIRTRTVPAGKLTPGMRIVVASPDGDVNVRTYLGRSYGGTGYRFIVRTADGRMLTMMRGEPTDTVLVTD